VVPATLALGLVCISIGVVALIGMKESFHAELDVLER